MSCDQQLQLGDLLHPSRWTGQQSTGVGVSGIATLYHIFRFLFVQWPDIDLHQSGYGFHRWQRAPHADRFQLWLIRCCHRRWPKLPRRVAICHTNRLYVAFRGRRQPCRPSFCGFIHIGVTFFQLQVHIVSRVIVHFDVQLTRCSSRISCGRYICSCVTPPPSPSADPSM